jgi:predicted nucleic acid-binding protein
MHKIFVDSDILLDVLSRRLPFYNDSASILTLAERKSIHAFTTPLVFANIFYVLRKLKSKQTALASLRKLRLIIKIFSISENNIDKALISKFNDFEDAIQYFAATDNGVGFIITRNKKDYKESKIPVSTPAEFLEMFNSQK